jgi:hypothetical protein
MEPVVVLTEAEARVMAMPELLAQIADNRAHPGRRRARRSRGEREASAMDRGGPRFRSRSW